MEQYDVVIVLGAQIVKNGDLVQPAYHTELRARAAGVAYQQGIADRFIVSGGHNVGVRYDFETNAIYTKPVFSFEAFARSRGRGPSEAQVIARVMSEEYGVPEEAVVQEDLSATTQENALFVRQILARTLAPDVQGTALSSLKKIGVITLLPHMERALKDFRDVGLEVAPLYAEDLLALDSSKNWIDEVAKYYSTPKGGKQWDAERIHEIMIARACGDTTRTIHELVEGGK